MKEKFVDGFKPDESGRYKGYVECGNGAFCRYSLSPQSKGKYAYRGTLSIMDPNGQGVLNVSSKALRTINAQRTEKGLPKLESKNASYSIYIPRKYDENGFELDAYSVEDIKACLIDHANSLYAENISAFSEGYDAFSSAADMYLPAAVEQYANEYIDGVTKTPTAQTRLLNRLKRGASQFSGKPIGLISSHDISAARRALGKTADTHLKELQKFTRYLYLKKHVSGDINPFETLVFKKNKRRQSPQRCQTEASNTDILSSAEEQKLNKYIEDNWRDSKAIGLLLIKEGRFDATDALKVKWGMLEWDSRYPNTVFVEWKRDNIGGATHDFTFPIVGFGARILLQHMEWVKAEAKGKEIDELPVVHALDNIYSPMDKDALVTSSREAIQGCGVGYARLVGRDEQHTVKYTDILHKTYDNHRATTFGLGSSQSMLDFLGHTRIKRDVLADHYRSHTDESARHMLVTALSQPLPYEENIVRKHNVSTTIADKQSVTTVEAPESRKATHIVIEYVLKPGERIMVSSAHGVKVHYQTD